MAERKDLRVLDERDYPEWLAQEARLVARIQLGQRIAGAIWRTQLVLMVAGIATLALAQLLIAWG